MADQGPDAAADHRGAPHPDSQTNSARAVFRDLNRNLIDLLGPCPETVDGAWVTVRSGEDGALVAGLPELSSAAALRVSSVLAAIGTGRDAVSPIPVQATSGGHSFDTYFGLSAAQAPSRVHVEVPR